ncbi:MULTISPECIES: hypothetical protein [Clostridium]|uniref:Uncharacterized protein n=3 Tax=Clostridium TaxID=1485 RepID=A0A381JCA0_9CLOT|nr:MULTISPECIES: hypothetical protein [Clostridium]MBU3219022.1 hypothetical protein [Clostridium algidicarnis]PPK48787.1 hypothetical protein BD821_10446 [Clostridium algidicarnis DSM 15099]SUY48388.1 Uncharacterised protein [Clostridium putrefaciens]
MYNLNCLSPDDLIILSAAISVELSKGKTADELNVLGNLIVAVGSLLLTSAAQKQNLDSKDK